MSYYTKSGIASIRSTFCFSIKTGARRPTCDAVLNVFSSCPRCGFFFFFPRWPRVTCATIIIFSPGPRSPFEKYVQQVYVCVRNHFFSFFNFFIFSYKSAGRPEEKSARLGTTAVADAVSVVGARRSSGGPSRDLAATRRIKLTTS